MDDEFLELTLQYAGQILKVRPQLQPVAFSDFLGTLQCLKPFLECALEKSAIPHEMRALFRKCTLVQVDAALLEKIQNLCAIIAGSKRDSSDGPRPQSGNITNSCSRAHIPLRDFHPWWRVANGIASLVSRY